ncbi:Death-associated protein kinase 1, partial [Cichlidogyrus casuarinus]
MSKDINLTIRKDNLEDFYIIGDKIGDGHFAEVKLATCKKTGIQYAAKFIIRKRQNMFGYVDPSAVGMTLNDIEREAKILAQLDNETIIKLFEVFHHKDSVVLILELVTGGELFARVAECERLSEEEASNFISQILYGVDHIHNLGIVHLDLK